jgi:hypothetical protein
MSSQVASNVFGLSHAVVHCNKSTTLEDFSNGILVECDRESVLPEDPENGPDSIRVSPIHSNWSPSCHVQIFTSVRPERY